MTSIDALSTQINKLAENHAHAEVCRAMAHIADTDAQRANLLARADYWDSEVATQHMTLTAVLNSAIPPTVYAHIDPGSPVRMISDQRGGIEVRGVLERGTRAVSIHLAAAQAVTVGTALVACAAVIQERGGGNLATILPPTTT